MLSTPGDVDCTLFPVDGTCQKASLLSISMKIFLYLLTLYEQHQLLVICDALSLLPRSVVLGSRDIVIDPSCFSVIIKFLTYQHLQRSLVLSFCLKISFNLVCFGYETFLIGWIDSVASAFNCIS